MLVLRRDVCSIVLWIKCPQVHAFFVVVASSFEPSILCFGSFRKIRFFLALFTLLFCGAVVFSSPRCLNHHRRSLSSVILILSRVEDQEIERARI